MLKLLTEADYKKNDKELIINIFGCLFQIDNSINLFPDSWGGKMDRFRLGVRTNAKKCRDLKQTRRYKLDFSRFCYCCCLFTLQFL